MGLGQGTSLSLRPGGLRVAAGTLGVCGWGAWGGARQQAFQRYSGGEGASNHDLSLFSGKIISRCGRLREAGSREPG